MANIIRMGQPVVYGAAVDNAESAYLQSVVLIDSAEFSSQYGKEEIMNNINQPAGVVLYNQVITGSISARLAYDPEQPQFAAVRHFQPGNMTASELLASAYPYNSSVSPLVDQTIYGNGPGEDVDFGSFVPVFDNVTVSLSNAAVGTFNSSGTFYKFADAFSIPQPS